MTRFKNRHRVNTTRLPAWDYTNPGWYFVTICTYHREVHFGSIVDDGVSLSPLGHIARRCWEEIPFHHEDTAIDAFVIMPNHVHGTKIIKPAKWHLDRYHPSNCEPVEP